MQSDATLRQVLASDPNSSTWLSANAGSGKTRVLTDRVARLLLQDVEPQRILCLTYTKSAASEMQNRLFKTLGEWAMKPDADLQRALSNLGDTRTDDQHLARARRLFARAIETPGGLRIQTIHSFCATLLRRFPLEAGVSPRFRELDDRAGRLLRQDILEEMCSGQMASLVASVAKEFSGSDFGELIEEVVAKRDGFDGRFDGLQLFGLKRDCNLASVLKTAFLGDEGTWMASLIPVLALGSTKDIGASLRLSAIDFGQPSLADLVELERLFLFGDDAKKATPHTAKLGSFPTKATQVAIGDNLKKLEMLMLRVQSARELRIKFQAAHRSIVLHDFARAFLTIYGARKGQMNWLDFDDLIARATQLVTEPSVASWVLYKLDGGIDHVLVDEAQDTSPSQWRLIELLTAEFTSGAGAHSAGRTIFVVGDQKQSIYSFQGADVAGFDAKHAEFSKRISNAKLPFQSLKLAHSFRSSPAILDFVDAAFRDRNDQALGANIFHIAFQSDLPGRVDFWPLIENEKDPVDRKFEDPIDLVRPTHHSARLADAIAGQIDAMLRAGSRIVTREGTRPVHAGDFMILVQRRSSLFTEIIRACKKRSLPIAGADRLKLGAELAVKDLLALLAFLDTPDDNLSLAAVLRSPLFGLTEAELFDVSYGRIGSLWQSLVLNKRRFSDAHAMLEDLRGQVDFLRPFELLHRILTEHDGRRRLITRLGDDAEDGIDELLNQALAYERGETPSLTGFLIWLDADRIDIKRQAEASGRRIRVMTVHGAKGLESEIVILPDTADHQSQDRNEIYVTDEGKALWKTPAAESPELVADIRVRKSTRETEENLRLLYVAMTRARAWLIICGAGTVSKEASWYNICREGMERVGALPGPNGLRYEFGRWPDSNQTDGQEVVGHAALPAWALSKPVPVKRASGLLTPSDLGGAKALAGEPEQHDALARGTAIHVLLQHLPAQPRSSWTQIAAHLVQDESVLPDAMAEAVVILDTPGLAHLFADGTLAEAALSGDLGGHRLFGIVDRLVISPNEVLAIDFKSNRLIPSDPRLVPEGLVRQLGAYHHLLSQLYPDRRVSTAILWTRSAHLMPIDNDIVKAALQRAMQDTGGAP